ncbi:hypothetical protein E1B25_18090 [Antarcticimicrobium sediminis]|uniref:Uncharacterized protein n=1 Tax=Antarcticimicrobium sediminis TaxID=2546227 RepID=A0A4R5EKV3_9RHOB|nr:hypothetical protein E1B25_18090 [Antarcticimicrobium sediminis]
MVAPVVAIFFSLFVAVSPARANGLVEPFIGDYVGAAEIVGADGERIQRDMNVSIRSAKKGFTVDWTSTTRKPDGRFKAKSYSITFLQTDRAGIYSAGMRQNVFGHSVPLDPIKGEPFVWGRIRGDTLTIFSLFVDENGDYEMQQFDRTLADGGLILKFSDLRNGETLRSVETFLERR